MQTNYLKEYLAIISVPDQGRNEEDRRIRFQQPGVSLGRGVQNFSSPTQWQNREYAHPVTAGDNESETEVATISAAITARDMTDLQNQALAAATIYPDSSLPSYSQGNIWIVITHIYGLNYIKFYYFE